MQSTFGKVQTTEARIFEVLWCGVPKPFAPSLLVVEEKEQKTPIKVRRVTGGNSTFQLLEVPESFKFNKRQPNNVWIFSQDPFSSTDSKCSACSIHVENVKDARCIYCKQLLNKLRRKLRLEDSSYYIYRKVLKENLLWDLHFNCYYVK